MRETRIPSEGVKIAMGRGKSLGTGKENKTGRAHATPPVQSSQFKCRRPLGLISSK